jgi:hypothetical protein
LRSMALRSVDSPMPARRATAPGLRPADSKLKHSATFSGVMTRGFGFGVLS